MPQVNTSPKAAFQAVIGAAKELPVFGQRVIPSMALAPSAHNTQPWRFVATETHIDIYIDWSRHLQISDANHRQLYISLGCAIENGVIAAQHWAYEPSVEYFPEGEGEDKPVVRLHGKAGKDDNEQVDELFAAIADRRTNRQFYDEEPLTSSERASLPTHNDDAVIFVEKATEITKLAELSAKGTEETLSRQDFKNELSLWVRSSFTSRNDGMPGYAMGMPAPISLISNFLVRLTPIHKQEAPKAKKQIESASAVAVIVTEKDDKVSWLNTGRIMERLWLEATAAGLGAMPVAAAIEASEEIRSQVAQALETKKHPQAIFRIGHTNSGILQATPRRSVQDCLA